MLDRDDDNSEAMDAPRLNAEGREALFQTVLRAFDDRPWSVGDIIPAQWFYDHLGVVHPSKCNDYEHMKREQFRWVLLFHGDDGFRRYLLKHRLRYLQSNHREGYIVLTSQQQVATAQRDRRDDINKALRNESMLLTHVDLDQLSQKERQQRDDALARNDKLAHMLRRRKPGF